MQTDEKHDTSASHGSIHASAVMIFATIADTTWRMFVPVLAGMLGGLWLDTVWATKPLLMFSGLGVGVLVAVLLVAQQLRAIMKERT